MALQSGLLYQYCGTIRQTWKRRNCILYQDGYLVIHQDGNHGNVVKKLLLQRCCKKVLTGIECHKWNSIVLPKGVQGLDCMFSIQVKHFTFKKDYVFLAESNEKCEEWTKMVEKVLFTSAMTGDCIGVFSEAMGVPTK